MTLTDIIAIGCAAVMDDGLRERMRRAVGARTWQEFLDAVYKLGLFRED